MNFRRFLLAAALPFVGGCINVDYVGKPQEWPRLTRVATTADLRGNYENNSTGTGGRRLGQLWFYLTRESVHDAGEATVRVVALDDSHLRVSLIAKSGGVLRTRDLASPGDFRIERGSVRLPTDVANSAQEAFEWGIGAGGTSCRLRKVADGSLVGEMYAGAVAIALFIPMAGFGDLWALWKSAPNPISP